VVGLQNADISDTLHLRDVPMVTIFGFLNMGCTLAPPGEYDWIVHVRWRCGLMSNYFDHLLFLAQKRISIFFSLARHCYAERDTAVAFLTFVCLFVLSHSIVSERLNWSSCSFLL